MFPFKTYFKTPREKLTIAFFITLVLSLATWLINRNAFDEINQVVKSLSLPNDRLDSLRVIQKEVTKFIYLDRLEVLNNDPELSEDFKTQHVLLKEKISRLKETFSADSIQFNRFEQIDSIMDLRFDIFDKYLKMRHKYITSGVFDEQFSVLNQLIDSENIKIDSNVVTTEKTTRKYTIYAPKTETPEKRRWFRKKKKVENETEPTVHVEEVQNVKIDTLAVSEKKDSILFNIEATLQKIEKTRNYGRMFLEQQESILTDINANLLTEFFNILSSVEEDEREAKAARAKSSIRISENTLDLTRILSAVFIFSALFLVVFILLDFSRMNNYRRQLEKAKDEAEFHNQAKQRFLSNMSHEIRTPLQAILGFSELLKQEQEKPSTAVNAISNAASHLLQVVNEILDYSKIISGKYTIEPVNFELSEVIVQMHETFAILCEQKGLTWIFIPPSQTDLPVLKADSFRIKQVLFNLLSNALKFTDTGSIRFQVQLDQEERVLIFDIIDTGKGIDKPDIDRVFKQYEQAKRSHEKSGTGLGLTIVRELINLMHGAISMKSEVGVGTAFSVRIPVEIVEASTISATPKELPSGALLDEIWVVDDDPLILSLYESIFTKHEIKFRCFSSAEDLLKLEFPPSLKQLYIDLRLPGISGLELCSILRNEFQLTQKIVAVTAQVLPQEKELVLNAGFDSIILKPFSQDALFQELYKAKKSDFNTEFDLSSVRKMIDNQDELDQIVLDFKQESKNDILQIQQLIEAESNENIHALVLVTHRLAGRFAQFGSQKYASYLRNLEQEMKENQSIEKQKLKNLLVELNEILE